MCLKVSEKPKVIFGVWEAQFYPLKLMAAFFFFFFLLLYAISAYESFHGHRTFRERRKLALEPRFCEDTYLHTQVYTVYMALEGVLELKASQYPQ